MILPRFEPSTTVRFFLGDWTRSLVTCATYGTYIDIRPASNYSIKVIIQENIYNKVYTVSKSLRVTSIKNVTLFGHFRPPPSVTTCPKTFQNDVILFQYPSRLIWSLIFIYSLPTKGTTFFMDDPYVNN